MTTPLLRVEGLTVQFRSGGGLLRAPKEVLTATDDVSFELFEGETLGLVGESGSGKSTTGRGILRLVEASAGILKYKDEDISALSGKAFKTVRRDLQMIFQDPYSSLDPSKTVEDLVAEPLDIHEPGITRSARRKRVLDALIEVDLREHHLNRYSYEFSGGQRQRIAIARSIVSNPRIIVCDEAVSALDVSTQSRIINLLRDLQKRHSLTLLFIAHDVDVVRVISDRIAVMYLGRIVEIGPSERVFSHPAHPYTEALISAIPQADPRRQRTRERIQIMGEIPSPLAPPSGCKFHTRCPYAMSICSVEAPPRVAVNDGGFVECHLQTSGPNLDGASLGERKIPDPR